MTIDDIKKYFGTFYRFNKLTGQSINNCYNWQKRGFIPIASQVKIEKLTGGELKASLEHIKND